MTKPGIPKPVLQRLPVYLNYLRALPDPAPSHISATALAAALHMGEVQVRKDLALVCASGRPKVGYSLTQLRAALEEYLGYNNAHDAVIVGAGRLGRALLEYEGFAQYGLRIVAAFDKDAPAVERPSNEKPILPMNRLANLCRRLNIKIGIITVPSQAAQQVCDQLIQNGILAVWNFAHTHLDVPAHVLVHNENMATSLALLSKHLREQIQTIE